MKKELGVLVRKSLNQPKGHSLLQIMASMYSIYSRGSWTSIYKQDDLWIHQCPDGAIVDRYVNFTATLAYYKAITIDYWCHFYKPQKGDFIMDVGAGIGTETAYFSQAVGESGQVFAIEAHPSTYAALALFCKLNHIPNVTKINVAIHGSEEDVVIDNPTSHVQSSIIGNTQGTKVRGTTIDQLSKDYQIKKIDFIKMNIEGAEKFALRGMSEVIQKTHYVCIACHDFMADQKEAFHTKKEVEHFLKDHNFQIMQRDGDSRPWVRDQVNAVNLKFLG